MTISSRTPEGFPSHCPLCGQAAEIEFSDPADDAPCPHCGQLLWLSTQVVAMIRKHLLGEFPDQPIRKLDPSMRLADLGDSLDDVELIMVLEEHLHFAIPDKAAEKIVTIADLIRYLTEHRSQPPS